MNRLIKPKTTKIKLTFVDDQAYKSSGPINTYRRTLNEGAI
jgi:hypothetical protein